VILRLLVSDHVLLLLQRLAQLLLNEGYIATREAFSGDTSPASS
jgi:hypothetical protein